MSKKFFKHLVVLLSVVFTFIFSLLIKVRVTGALQGDKSEKAKFSFFEFIKQTRDAETLGFTRVFMWIGFILLLIVLVYQVVIFVLSLLKQDKIVNKLTLISKITNFILVGAVFILLVAGLGYSSYEITIPVVGAVTQKIHASLFGVSWTLALIFSLIPLVIDYLIKE